MIAKKLNNALVCCLLVALLTISVLFFFSSNDEVCSVDCNPEAGEVASQTQIVEEHSNTVESKTVSAEAPSSNGPAVLPVQIPVVEGSYKPEIMSFDEDWCVAKEELSQSDIDYVATLEQDWSETVGRAFAKSGVTLEIPDEFTPNNSSVAPYQELPAEELQDLALSGDKWAMITFLQKGKYRQRKAMREVANRLLIQGASYHALEYLVIEELADAKSSFRSTGEVEQSTEHMINAVAYVMLGLKDNTISGLIAYMGNITRNEFFLGRLHPNAVLANKASDIRDRYQELEDTIARARDAELIELPETPEAVKRLFNQDLAGFQYKSPDAMAFLRSLNVTPDVVLDPTPCTEKYFARMAILQKYHPDNR